MKAMEAALLGAGDDIPLLSRQVTVNGDFMRLCICKLDDSSFDVKVRVTATVHDLKINIQEIFRGEEDGDISWCHVWSNFCLSFEDNKLVDDSLVLNSLGIKDGDQLFFERHLSSAYKRKSMLASKKGKSGLIKRRPSDAETAEEPRIMAKIELHWTNVLRTWAVYAKLWITGMKADCRKLSLRQKPHNQIVKVGS